MVREGVTIIGQLNLPATMPVHASQMYARVIQNFLGLLIKDDALDVNLDDDVIKGMCITRGGEVVQEMTRKAMKLDDAPATEPVPPSSQAEPAPSPVEPPPAEAESAAPGSIRADGQEDIPRVRE